LESVFGYKEKMDIKMPYLHADKELICVDDPNSRYYNQIIKMPKDMPKSFELMKRDDNQYELGIVVAHNKVQLEGAGSCIFMHVQKDKNSPTIGCTSMSMQDLQKIVAWLDIEKKPILIQVTKKQLHQVLELYPNLELEQKIEE
jgi:D-alanyl-D-alanine dipeptidase